MAADEVRFGVYKMMSSHLKMSQSLIEKYIGCHKVQATLCKLIEISI